MKRKAVFFTVSILVLAMILVAGCGTKQQPAAPSDKPSDKPEGWVPNSTIEIIAPASPGGGWDLTSRAMQKTLNGDKIVDKNIIITNKPGGSVATGWTYLKGKAGDAHYLAVNSSLVLLNNLLGRSELTFDQFTPLANLSTEWCAVSVKPDSKFKTATEVLDALKADPTSLTIGVAPGLGNDDHLSFVLTAKQYGVDVKKLKFVVFEGGGDVVMALLGGHIDVSTGSVSEAIEQQKAGKVKILAITADKRMDEIPDAPTWKELGVDVVFPHWRGVMGPPDMTPEQIKYWDDALSKMVQQDSWKESLVNLQCEPYYMNSTEFKEFLTKQNEELKQVIDELGLRQ